MTREIDRLQDILGYRFANPDLLARALTHASAVNGRDMQNYQRLEFLGDRVLGLVVADMLVERFPEAPEGELSRRLARLVSRETCTEIAGAMQLEKYLRIGGGQKNTVRPSAGMLSDVCEAVIAAVYRDGGIDAARALIARFWGERIAGTGGPLRDAKTELQEWAHKRGLEPPAYSETLRSGPDHAPVFEIEVQLAGVAPARGSGGSKREAEQEAAAALLRREGVWGKA
jgi:ribonuclease-3